MSRPATTGTAACLSHLGLDRWVADEVVGAERGEIEEHLRTCARCSSRLAARQDEQRLFQTTAPAFLPAPLASPPRPRRWHRLGTSAVLVAAVAAGVLLFARARTADAPAPSRETVLGKGGQRFRYFVRDSVAGTVREGGPQEPVHPDDQIRFAFDLSRAGASKRGAKVAVLGRDASGRASVYFPDGATTAAPSADADGLVAYSVKLDATLGIEMVYAIFCQDAVALGPLQAALARGDTPLGWPAGCETESVQWEKKPRP